MKGNILDILLKQDFASRYTGYMDFNSIADEILALSPWIKGDADSVCLFPCFCMYSNGEIRHYKTKSEWFWTETPDDLGHEITHYMPVPPLPEEK